MNESVIVRDENNNSVHNHEVAMMILYDASENVVFQNDCDSKEMFNIDADSIKTVIKYTMSRIIGYFAVNEGTGLSNDEKVHCKVDMVLTVVLSNQKIWIKMMIETKTDTT